MEKYIMPRGRGKTILLIHESERTQIPIMCSSKTETQIIKDRAKEMGCSIPQPISANDTMSLKGKRLPRVLIDNADVMLSQLVKKLYGAEIEAFTMSIDD